MKLCKICGRISATGQDHLDCVQRRGLEAEEEAGGKGGLAGAGVADGGLDVGIRAILEQMAKDKGRERD